MLGSLRGLRSARSRGRGDPLRRAGPAFAAPAGRLRPRGDRGDAGQHPRRPARLFRQHLLYRRRDRGDPRRARHFRDGGRHDRRLHLRPRRHAGRAGLWFKMGFHEGSARVPLLFAGPGIARAGSDAGLRARRGADDRGVGARRWQARPPCPATASTSRLRSGRGVRPRPVPLEYAAEGSVALPVCLRDGRFKLVLCAADPALLYDLEADPAELHDLAGTRRSRRCSRA